MSEWASVAMVLVAVLAGWLIFGAVAWFLMWREFKRRMERFDAEEAETDAHAAEISDSIRRGAYRTDHRFRL